MHFDKVGTVVLLLYITSKKCPPLIPLTSSFANLYQRGFGFVSANASPSLTITIMIQLISTTQVPYHVLFFFFLIIVF